MASLSVLRHRQSFSPRNNHVRAIRFFPARLSCRNSRSRSCASHSAPHPLPTFVRHLSSGTLARQSYSPFRHYVRPGCSIPSIWSRYIRLLSSLSLSLFFALWLRFSNPFPLHPFPVCLTPSFLRVASSQIGKCAPWRIHEKES